MPCYIARTHGTACSKPGYFGASDDLIQQICPYSQPDDVFRMVYRLD